MDTIHFVNNWGQSPAAQLERYLYYTPNHDGVWESLRPVLDAGRADYLVVMDGLPPQADEALSAHPRKLFFQREPLDIKPLTLPSGPLLFQGSYDRHYQISTWMLRLPFKRLMALPPPETTKPLSAVMSAKTRTPGQRQRLQALRDIRAAVPRMDIYGRGLDPVAFGGSYKGPLEYNQFCKLKGLYGYAYSLAFENSRHPNYFTEKIIDCFLSWSKPLYWGCPNIDRYFPKESYAVIDIESPDLVEQVRHELSRPVDLEALREARELVMNRYSPWPSIRRVIDAVGENAA